MKKFTHVGHVVGTGDLYPSYNTKFRETKTLWVTPKGIKFRKSDGFKPNDEWPKTHLDLATVAPINFGNNHKLATA